MNKNKKTLVSIFVGLSIFLIYSFKHQLPEYTFDRISHAITHKKAQNTKQTPLSILLKKGTKILIKIDKSDYQLNVYSSDTLIKTYPVVFGGNPIDDKLQQGDSCTPEGDFYIVSKYPHRSWSKFIWINYPTADSWRKHKKAKADGSIPKNAKIGGEIGIHGVPEGTDTMISNQFNWTLGCISLKNKDINEIYPFIDKKTRIHIQK
jgi:murein L,D-transpeptidase YafK